LSGGQLPATLALARGGRVFRPGDVPRTGHGDILFVPMDPQRWVGRLLVLVQVLMLVLVLLLVLARALVLALVLVLELVLVLVLVLVLSER
jgi:hypothetical protein